MLHRRFHFAKSFGTMAILAIACTLSPNARAETVVRKESGTNVPMISRATMDAMKRSVADRFILPGNLKDAGSVKLQFRVKLGKDGKILGTPEADASGGSEATRKTIRTLRFVRSSARLLSRCSQKINTMAGRKLSLTSMPAT